jgi:co-chaperonin GroES (HSP10)
MTSEPDETFKPSRVMKAASNGKPFGTETICTNTAGSSNITNPHGHTGKPFGAPASTPIPDRVFLERHPQIDVKEESSREERATTEADKLPRPTGYRVLIVPYAPPAKSRGGIHFANQTTMVEDKTGVVGFVIALGPDCYKDTSKYPEGPWCKAGDYVIFGRYAGAKLELKSDDDQPHLPVRILNDDEILATVSNPEDYVGIN